MIENEQYPKISRTESVKDNYFGKEIHDPYRWLEEDYSEKTKQFVQTQNYLTEQYLIENVSNTDTIRVHLENLCLFNRYTCPLCRKNRTFQCYLPLMSNQCQLKMYDNENNISTDLLNPDQMNLTYQETILAFNLSKCGQFLCYEVYNSNKKYSELRFKSIDNNLDLEDCIQLSTKSSFVWSNNSKGIYYTSKMKPENFGIRKKSFKKYYSNYLYYHELGSEQKFDNILWGYNLGKNKSLYFDLSDCGRYIIFTFLDQKYGKNRLSYADLELKRNSNQTLKVVTISADFDACYEVIATTNDYLYVKTNMNAPFYKIIRIVWKEPEWSNWEEFIIHEIDSKLEHAVCVNETHLVVHKIKNLINYLFVYDLETGSELFKFELPHGKILNLTGYRHDSRIFLKLSSFVEPCTILCMDLSSESNKKIEIFQQAKLEGIEPNDYEVKLIHYKSDDQTNIPMFIFKHKDIVLDGTAPCKLTAFGGFGLINLPFYSASNLLFVKHYKGIFVMANVRGGGEYGEQWHAAGRTINKPTTIRDLINAAEFLIKNNYTNENRIFIEGKENGGLIAIACCNQKPNLFKAAILDNPLSDMLRYFKYSPTSRWLDEYGNPFYENLFKILLSYSPIHNLPITISENHHYPSVLILADKSNTNVEQAHSYKLLATLQYNQNHSNPNQSLKPILGWFSGTNHFVCNHIAQLDKVTYIWAFIQHVLNLQWYE